MELSFISMVLTQQEVTSSPLGKLFIHCWFHLCVCHIIATSSGPVKSNSKGECDMY